MLERQREGIARAKGLGKYTGRQPTARRRMDEIIELFNQGLVPGEIAAALEARKDAKGKAQKISTASVYRLLAEAKGEGRLGEVRREVRIAA